MVLVEHGGGGGNLSGSGKAKYSSNALSNYGRGGCGSRSFYNIDDSHGGGCREIIKKKIE